MADKIGCTAETLRHWVRQAERDVGRRPGLSTEERARMKEREREVRRANEILRKASAFFAQAELDRRPRQWCKSFTIMVRPARLPWHPAAGLALPADDGRLWRGVKRAGWNRAHDLATGAARALRCGDGAACALGGRVEGTGGRLVRFGPGFVAVARTAAVAAVAAAGCMYPVGQSRREGSIHRQPPGGTRIASAHGPCQGATRLLQDLPWDCLLRWALHKTHLDVWEWMHFTRLFKGQRSPILGELLRGGQLGGREFAGQRVADVAPQGSWTVV